MSCGGDQRKTEGGSENGKIKVREGYKARLKGFGAKRFFV